MVCKSCNEAFCDMLAQCPFCGASASEEDTLPTQSKGRRRRFNKRTHKMQNIGALFTETFIGFEITMYCVCALVLLFGLHMQYPQVIYEKYGLLRRVDICFAIIALGMGGLWILAGYLFKRRRKSARTMILFLCILGIVCSFGYGRSFCSTITDVSFYGKTVYTGIGYETIQYNVWMVEEDIANICGSMMVVNFAIFVICLIYFIVNRKNFAK